MAEEGWGVGGQRSEIQADSEHHNGTMACAHFTKKKVLFLEPQGEDAAAGNLPWTSSAAVSPRRCAGSSFPVITQGNMTQFGFVLLFAFLKSRQKIGMFSEFAHPL